MDENTMVLFTIILPWYFLTRASCCCCISFGLLCAAVTAVIELYTSCLSFAH